MAVYYIYSCDCEVIIEVTTLVTTFWPVPPLAPNFTIRMCVFPIVFIYIYTCLGGSRQWWSKIQDTTEAGSTLCAAQISKKGWIHPFHSILGQWCPSALVSLLSPWNEYIYIEGRNFPLNESKRRGLLELLRVSQRVKGFRVISNEAIPTPFFAANGIRFYFDFLKFFLFLNGFYFHVDNKNFGQQYRRY